MVNYQDVFDTTKKAFDLGEFYELLTGKNGYDVPVLDVPVDVPTDWTVVLPNGIYKLYKEHCNEEIITQYSIALRKMINNNSTELWMAANILFNQLKSQKRGSAPFMIPDDILILFNKNLFYQKNELSENQNFGGNQYTNGLLGDIERLNRILFTNYEISMVINND